MQLRASTQIGRRFELREVERILRNAQTGAGRALFILGEAGIGKSRLLAEAKTIAEQLDVRVMRGRSSSIGPKAPYRPLIEALTSLFRSGDPPDGSRLGPYRTVLGRIVPDWHADLSVVDNTSPAVLAEAVLRLLCLIGADGGCVLMLEDLHASDPETLAVLDYLIDNVEYQPIAIVATSRYQDAPALDMARAAAQRKTCEIVEMSPLDHTTTREFIASFLDTTAAGVPVEVADRLFAVSGGVPLLVEELLRPMLEDGTLVNAEGRWRVANELRTAIPTTLMRTLTDRVNQLGPDMRALVSVAALLGERFPLDVLQHAIDLDYAQLVTRLYALTEAQLIIADDRGPDWYTFRHPLIIDAVLGLIGPDERADLARRAAQGIEQVYPDFDGEWCELVASLRVESGDHIGAAQLLLVAGGRARAAGAPGSAATLLQQALELLAGSDAAGLRIEILSALIPALGEQGDFDRAFQLYPVLSALPDEPAARPRQVALHTEMATVALHAGRWELGVDQVDRARALLSTDATDEETAAINVIAAKLMIHAPSPNSAGLAEELVRKAAPAAERAGLIPVACQAWEQLGVLTRERDPDEATKCFEHALRLAERHQMPIERISALIRLGGNEWLFTGDTATLELASQEASRLGDVIVGYNADAALALQLVLTGQFETARERLDQCWSDVSRLKLKPLACYVLMAKATLAAHQADRRGMKHELAMFNKWGGDQSHEASLVYGLARAFCALLEDNVPVARRELAMAVAIRRKQSATFHLVGDNGLQLLLRALANELSWATYREVESAAATRMRWNRLFALFAEAVLLGRDGRTTQAAAAMAAAAETGEIYPVAWHLGLRLVAPAAHADGWGDPIAWLREAEGYFHGISANPLSSACRALLRQFGAPVQPHRRDSDRVPAELRKLGVTVREHEVFKLLARRLSNKELADELHISPRTVEKHVANLIAKTDQPNRNALNRLAENMVDRGD